MKQKIKKSYDKLINLWDKFINLRFNKIFFKFLPHNLFLFILFIVSIFTIVKFYNENKYLYYYQQTSSSEVTDRIYDTSYDISFENIDLEGNPSQFCLKFLNEDNAKTSDYRYLLYHNDELVTDVIFNAKDAINETNYCFDVPTLNKDNVKEYKVSIAPINATKENSIAIFTSSKGVPTMCFISSEKLLSVRNIIALIFIILFFIINYIINKKDIKAEGFYLILASGYIFFSIFFVPPYQVPDELIHYVNTINLTQIDYTKNLYTQFEEKEITVPEGNMCLAYTSPQKVDKLVNIDEFKDCFKPRNNKTKSEWHINSKSKTGYIFAAIAYKIVDIFSNRPMILFYSGRIINSLISMIIIYFAIKNSKKHKLLLLSMATIPTFLQLMISYSYDSILNTLSFLVIWGVLSLRDKKDSSLLKWSIVFAICGILISDIKVIYLPILLLLLLIPKDKFKKTYLKWLYIIGIIIIAYFIGQLIRWYVEYNPSEANDLSLSLFSGKKFNYQNIKEHPLMIFSIAFYTFKYQLVFYLRGFFGYFGWFRYRIHDVLVFAYCLYMIYLFTTHKGLDDKKYKKIIITISLLISMAAVFAAMYFGWSRPGLGYVEGVQGRYFIPIILPLFLVLLPKKEYIKQDNKINYTFINIMLIQYILILLFGYY